LIGVAVVVAEALIREALTSLVNADGALTVVADAANAVHLFTIVPHSSIDVIVSSLTGAAADADAALVGLRHLAERPCPTLVLIRDGGPFGDVPLIDLGARGVVRTDETATVLRQAIRTVHVGELWVNRSTLTTLVHRVRHQRSEPDGEVTKVRSLTGRECEVLRAVSEGLSNAQIAERLFISPDTVRNHVSAILGKLELANRFQLAAYAFRRGLVVCPPTADRLEMSVVMTTGRRRDRRVSRDAARSKTTSDAAVGSRRVIG
jgi:DNA-binding NarL/FixJ family response regulator